MSYRSSYYPRPRQTCEIKSPKERVACLVVCLGTLPWLYSFDRDVLCVDGSVAEEESNTGKIRCFAARVQAADKILNGI